MSVNMLTRSLLLTVSLSIDAYYDRVAKPDGKDLLYNRLGLKISFKRLSSINFVKQYIGLLLK